MKKILYIMYSNPCGSPQLGNSAGILADQGWKVAFLGTGSLGTNEFRFAQHSNIQVHLWRFRPGGISQKIQFCLFFLRCLWWVLTWRPNFVHGSDPYSTPFLYVISLFTWTPIIYQEHDSPNIDSHPSWFQKFTFRTRTLAAQRAFCNLLPNKDRALIFRQETKTSKPVEILWNVPRKQVAEIVPEKADRFTLFYHGSIVPVRLPLTVVQALAQLPKDIELVIAGYETVGSRGYLDRLLATAKEEGVESRIKYLGSFSYHDLIPLCRKAHVGISFMPEQTSDVNEKHMVGASIKAFDYMACGVALLVTNLSEWVETYVEPGYGRACDPKSPQDIAKNILLFYNDLDNLESLEKRSREKIRSDWNYENKMSFLLTMINK